MKTILILLFGIITFFLNPAVAQSSMDSIKISKNTIYLEAFGNGGIYSINYDRIVFSKKLFKISGRVGVSYIPYPLSYTNIFFYPTELNFLCGKKHYGELGIGYTPVFRLYKKNLFKIYDFYSYTGIRIGYRFQKNEGGFFVRAGLMYVIKLFNDYSNNKGLPLWFGLGLGYTLKQK